MAASGPTTVRVGNWQIYSRRLFFFPHRTGDLFTVKQVMFDTCKHAAPVTTVERFINYSPDFYIHSVATENSVVNTTEQIQKPALFSLRGIVSGLLTIAPRFGFVLPHGC